MLWLARLFLIFTALLALSLAALFFAPAFMDWSKYTSEFERQASKALGTRVRVAGATDLRILPTPKISFNNIEFGSQGDDFFGSAERFAVDMDLSPFARGELRILDMRLIKPVANIVLNEEGALPHFTTAQDLVTAENVVLEKLNVIDGRLALVSSDAEQDNFAITGINADLSARRLAGPWRAKGNGTASSNPFGWNEFEFNISTGKIGLSKAFGLRAELKPLDKAHQVLLSGTIEELGTKPKFDGQVKINKTPFVGDVFANVNPAWWAFEAKAKIDKQKFESNLVSFSLLDPKNPYTLDAQLSFDWSKAGNFKLKASGPQIEASRFAKANQAAGAYGASDILQSVRDALPLIQRKGSVNLSVPGFVAGNAVLRNIRLNADSDGKNWKISQLSVDLPGLTKFRANGKILTDAGSDIGLGFDGAVVLASNQPAAFAGAFMNKVPDQIRRLQRGGIAADLYITGNTQRLGEVELDLDGAQVRGSLERLLNRNTGINATTLEVAGDFVDFDNLLSANLDYEQVLNLLQYEQISAKFELGGFRAQGVRAGPVSGKLNFDAPSIFFSDVSFEDLAGLNLTLNGDLNTINHQSNQRSNAHLEALVSAPNLVGAAKNLRRLNAFPKFKNAIEKIAQEPQLSRNAALRVDYTSGKKNALEVTGELGGTSVGLKYSSDGMPQGEEMGRSIALSAENADGSALLSQLGFYVLPSPQFGALKVNYNGEEEARSGVFASKFSLIGENITMSANGAARFIDGLRGLSAVDFKGEVSAQSSNLEPSLNLAGVLLDPMLGAVRVDFKSPIELENGILFLSDIQSNWNTVETKGRLRLDFSNERTKIDGAVDLAQIDARYLTDLSLGQTVDFEDKTVFLDPVWRDLDVDISLKSPQLRLGEITQFENFSTQLKVSDEKIRFSDISASKDKGVAKGEIAIAQIDKLRAVDVQINAKALPAALLNRVLKSEQLFEGSANLQLDIQTSGNDETQLLEGLTGVGFLSVDQFEAAGVSTSFLPSLASWADNQEETPNVDVLNRELASFLALGSLTAPKLELPFSLASGRLRANSVLISNDEAELSFSTELNIPKQSYDLSVLVNLPAKQLALEGGQPQFRVQWEGVLGDQNARRLDVSALQSFLTLRDLERRRREAAILDVKVFERQRLRRFASYYQRKVDRLAAEKAQRLQQERELEAKRAAAVKKRNKQEAAALAAQQAAERAFEADRRNGRIIIGPLRDLDNVEGAN